MPTYPYPRKGTKRIRNFDERIKELYELSYGAEISFCLFGSYKVYYRLKNKECSEEGKTMEEAVEKMIKWLEK